MKVDLCQQCEYFYRHFQKPPFKQIDFRGEPHCKLVDAEYGFINMSYHIIYPTIECPYNHYSPKKDIQKVKEMILKYI